VLAFLLDGIFESVLVNEGGFINVAEGDGGSEVDF